MIAVGCKAIWCTVISGIDFRRGLRAQRGMFHHFSGQRCQSADSRVHDLVRPYRCSGYREGYSVRSDFSPRFRARLLRVAPGVPLFLVTGTEADDRRPMGRCSCPRALVAKRGDVRIREKEGFNFPWFCEHRSTREPKAVVCTLGTLNTDCGEAFSLLRFFVAVGQRNEVPPRTVANSDKKYSQHTTRANVSSTTRRRPIPPDIEMKSRHGQWLIVIKNLANIEPALT